MPASAAMVAIDAARPSRWTIRSAASSSSSRRAARSGAASAPPVTDRRSLTRSLRSRDLVTGDGTADDEPLDLAGALEDRVDLRVAVPPLHRVLAGVAVAAEDLDRLLGHLDRGLPGEQLAHRALACGEGDVVLAHPRRAPDQQ